MPQLILLRHGQSTWNLENLFTGWTDVPLTDQGATEAAEAGRLLAEAELLPDIAYTSLQRRAIDTLNISLAECDRGWIPVARHWRLNERHYGALQGLDKKETAALHGVDQVQVWRRSYDTPPPALELTDPRHPRHDARYAHLPSELLPATECLKDVVERMLPYWYDAIAPQLMEQKVVIVAAHGNSLRALVKHLDGISDAAIAALNIPTGIPLVYELDDDLKRLSSRYLGDAEEAAAAAAAIANQANVG